MMDNRSTFLYHLVGAKWGRKGGAQPGAGHPGAKRLKNATAVLREKPQVCGPHCQEKPRSDEDQVLVPQTDTGRRVEDTKADGRTFVKEFGKLAP
jgi:hypothetical protein